MHKRTFICSAIVALILAAALAPLKAQEGNDGPMRPHAGLVLTTAFTNAYGPDAESIFTFNSVTADAFRYRLFMKTYATMARHNPDFFIHSGDTVYCDGPIKAEAEIASGGVWKNILAEGVEKVAATLDEYRGRWKYNLHDDHLKEFNAQVPTFFQWDDHEVTINWSAAKDLSQDERYREKSIGILSARAGRAFHEMTPIRYVPEEPGRVYRKVSYGPMLDIIANGEQGPAKGRELEIADLLRFIKISNIQNSVWLTADVHYTAAHYYTPDKAQFQDFTPFWEFVSGPIHAGTFGPGDLDMTFGPELKFVKAPSKEQGQNLPPSAGLQFFGIVDIDDKSEQMTVKLMDRDDKELYKMTLDAERMG